MRDRLEARLTRGSEAQGNPLVDKLTGGQGRQKQGDGVENPVPEPGAEDLNLRHDGRDLRPERG